MPPNILADFCLKAGIGSARFGNLHKGQEQLRTALDVATKSRLNELVFRVERIMAGLRDCATECETIPRTDAEPAVSTEALRGVSASLARLEDGFSGRR